MNHDNEKGGGLYEPQSHYENTDQAGLPNTTLAGARGGETHRGLKSRHIQFLYVLSDRVVSQNLHLRRALGGAIGTGLFVGSGAILALVGPAPLFMAYLVRAFFF